LKNPRWSARLSGIFLFSFFIIFQKLWRCVRFCLFLQANILIYMTRDEKTAYWLDLADYDIETAEAKALQQWIRNK